MFLDYDVLAELGVRPEQVPPAIEVEDKEGGLRKTPLGWVIEIPAHLSPDKKLAFYLHCVGHYILEHYSRKLEIIGDDKTWDAACDYAVNSLLMFALSYTQNEKLKRARQHLYPYRKEFEGLSAEAIYLTLMEERNTFTFGDSHSDFGEGGAQAQKVRQLGAVNLDAMQAGTNKEDATMVINLKRNVMIPAALQNLFAHSPHTEELLDILFIPYNKYWTVEMTVPHLTAYHCADISGSMQPFVVDVLSVLWALVGFLYNFFSGRVRQRVSLMDVSETFKWEGVAPDLSLFKGLRKPKGFGGTTYSTILSWELRDKIPDCLILYSDLAFSPGLPQERWNFLRKEIIPKIPISVLVYPEDELPRISSFKVVVPLRSFFRGE